MRLSDQPGGRRRVTALEENGMEGSDSVTSSITKLSSRQKRKRDEGSVDENGGVKRSRLRDGRTYVEVATNAENGDQETTDLPSIQEPEVDSLVGFENETYGNCIHYCLVAPPAGGPPHAYWSTKELLEALPDAIKGHKSLLENGKILHHDISENNIFITEAGSEGDQEGILIDLDLAKELNSVTSGASRRTGTRTGTCKLWQLRCWEAEVTHTSTISSRFSMSSRGCVFDMDLKIQVTGRRQALEVDTGRE